MTRRDSIRRGALGFMRRVSLSARSLAAGVVALALTGLLVVPTLAAQAPPVRPAPRPAPRPAAAPSGVDTVIQLVKGGLSETLVLKTIQDEGKTYKLSTADLLKLHSAGVSETIINAMTGAGGTAA